MKIAVFGTGMVGQTIAGKLHDLGHDVTMGTRNVEETMARSKPDGMGTPPVSEWIRNFPKVKLKAFTEAAAGAEMVVNATSGMASLEALKAAGSGALDGKLLIDISNPLDFSKGMPPSLFVGNTDSLAETLQREFPKTHVVKTLNTMTAALMVKPLLLGNGDHTVFMGGNDAGAKTTVKALLESMGWKDILDLGDLTSARGMEGILPIWVRLFGTLGSPMIQFKVIRT